MVGRAPWDGIPLIINHIYTLYHVGIYWVRISPDPTAMVKQLGAGYHPKGFPSNFPMNKSSFMGI